MAYEYESKETRVLKTIDSQRYPETNKDFVKNIRRLNSNVDYISSYMRVMQKGIDDANMSFIEQIQQFINDLVVIFAGGEPTGIELGDLKYILQAIGALFGFQGPFPINLFNAAAHFFEFFLAPITQLSDLIFDSIEAWMLDLIAQAGNIPIIGGAITSFAQWIIDITNGAQQAIDDAVEALAHAGEIIDSFLRAIGVPTWGDVEKWFENLSQGLLYGVNLGDGFSLAEAAQAFINTVLFPVNMIAKLVGGFIQALNIPGLDASKIISGVFAQEMIQDLVSTLNNIWSYIGTLFNTFLTALGLPTWEDVETWFTNLFQGFLYGIDFGDGFDLGEAAQMFINIVLFPVNMIAKLVGGFLEGFRIPGLDASKITSGTFAQSMVSGLTDVLVGLADGIQEFIDAVISVLTGIPIVGGLVQGVIDGFEGLFNFLFGVPVPQPTIQAPAVPSIDASKVNTGQFGSGQIADSAITTSKINNGAVTGTKVGTSAIGTTNIADAAITGAKTSGLDGSKITTGTVAAANIGVLPTSKITTGTFGTSFIADSAITNAKLGSLSVASGNIQDSAVTGAKTSTLDASKITTGSLGSGQISDNAITSAKILDGAVGSAEIGSNAVSTAKIADSAVTGAKTTGLDASKITSGQLSTNQLPVALQSVGSGVICVKTSGTYTTLFNASGTRLPYNFYTSIPTNTSDITISGTGNNPIGFTASNAGWYIAELGFQLGGGGDFIDFPYSWSLTPVIFKNISGTPSIFKWGNSSLYFFNTAPFTVSYGQDFVQSSFVLYLTANETIWPGYFWSRRDTNVNSAEIIKAQATSTSNGTYFAMSLLNRSLA